MHVHIFLQQNVIDVNWNKLINILSFINKFIYLKNGSLLPREIQVWIVENLKIYCIWWRITNNLWIVHLFHSQVCFVFNLNQFENIHLIDLTETALGCTNETISWFLWGVKNKLKIYKTNPQTIRVNRNMRILYSFSLAAMLILTHT